MHSAMDSTKPAKIWWPNFDQHAHMVTYGSRLFVATRHLGRIQNFTLAFQTLPTNRNKLNKPSLLVSSVQHMYKFIFMSRSPPDKTGDSQNIMVLGPIIRCRQRSPASPLGLAVVGASQPYGPVKVETKWNDRGIPSDIRELLALYTQSRDGNKNPLYNPYQSIS